MAETVRKYSLAALRNRLFRISLVFTVLLAIGLAMFVFSTSSMKAATYQTSTGLPSNWTGGGVWTSCTAGAPGALTCGAYPGSGGVDGDIAKLGIGDILVNSNIANAVTLDMSGATGHAVNIQAPGVLRLTGNSVLSSSTAGNSLNIQGGTLINNGNLTVGGAAASSLTFPGGTFSGAGITTIVSPNGTFSVSSTIAPNPTISQQTINNNNAANFSASTLTMSNAATINNAGTFTVNGAGTIAAGAGSGLFTNTGSILNNTSFTMNIPLVNTGTASDSLSLATSNFNGGSGPGGHVNSTWNVLGPTAVMGFGGTHVFTGTQSFPAGNGQINITGPVTFNPSTALLTIGNGISVNNSTGTIDFGTTTLHTMAIGAGNYTQGGGGTLKVKLGPNPNSDRIQINGAATLGGTLIAGLAPAYTPADGDTFTVITDTGGQVGTFTYTPLAYSNGFFQIVYNPSNVQLIAVPQTDISVVKTGPATVNDGANATYLITVTNNGPSAATGVSISDTFSGPATVVSATPSTGSCSGTGPVTCTFPGLANGNSATVSLVLATTGTGTILNTATLGSTTPADSNPGNNTSTVSTTVTPSANLSLALSAPTPANAASTVNFTATVANAGPDPANAPTASFSIVNGTITSASGVGFTCTNTPTTASCTATGPMPASGSGTITLVTTAPNQPGTMSMNGSVTSTTFDPNAANNTATASVTINAVSDVSVAKTLTSPFVAGTNVTYNIVVSNAGPSDAANVVVSDAPGAGLTFVSNSGACTTAFPCTIPNVPAAGSATIVSTFALSPGASGTITNTASAAATGDPNAGNNSGPASALVTTSADLSIVKTLTGSLVAGSNATYTITVTNNGPSDAGGVSVTDPTPAGMSFVSNTGGCTTAFPCNLGTLTSGSSVTINSTYAVAPTATGTISNAATVSSTATPDPSNANNSSTATATVGAATADVGITKTGPSALPVSGSVTFTITVKNLGPGTATNVMVNDVASRLVFVSNSGACSTPFPCSLGNMAPGATAVINSTFTVTTGAQFASNNATVTSSSFDPNSANDSSTVTLGQTCPSIPPSLISPTAGQTGVPVAGTITWTSSGGQTYQVFLGKAGTGCNTLVATVNGTSYAYSGLDPNTDYEVRILSVRSGCPALSSPCVAFRTGQSTACNLAAPTLLSPPEGNTVPSPVHLTWSAVPGATTYNVVVTLNGNQVVATSTANTFLDVTVDPGNVVWTVQAVSGNCTGPLARGTFITCGNNIAPVAGVVGAPSSGRSYQVVIFNADSLGTLFEYFEADNPNFNNAKTQVASATFMSYAHLPTPQAQVFFYRVRSLSCGPQGIFSKTLRVVILPNVVSTRPVLNIPAGTRDEQTLQIFIQGESTRVAFTATSDRPWITRIDPSSGILPTEGITLTLHIDPSQLPNGTFTASVIITESPLTEGRITTHGNNSSKGSPVTINLVTPVVPVDNANATDDSFIIPAVGHLVGLNSQWRSDVRIFNPSSQAMTYTLNFLSAGSTDVKQTTIQTDPGATTALDDIIHNWYGVGEVGDSATGVLQVVPAKSTGQSALASLVTSRTYSLAGDGTLGEFIPGIPLKQFITTGSRLSLQQISQTSNFRTNFGLVEASGKPTSLVLSMFNSAGSKLFDLPVNLAANEQRLLNGLLTQQGVSNLTDGRMEVRVSGGDGKITAYASVVDNTSENPLFVPASVIGSTSAQLYVVPGVADLNNGAASWRTDMRIFNASTSPQSAELVYYPSGPGTAPFFATVNINPGEVKVLDNLVSTTFGQPNTGGAVHINTTNNSQLVVTARTYNQTAQGTLGQFVPGATLNDAINKASNALNILQVEDSSRFRTNVGLAEMTGKPATVEVSVILPDSKITPTIEVPLAANEFRQFGLSEFGLGNVYNARVNVKVVNGDGTVTAYGSVIDQITTAPTYVAAK
jgi:uncharacterized repeat protein (TIGR01451 family)